MGKDVSQCIWLSLLESHPFLAGRGRGLGSLRHGTDSGWAASLGAMGEGENACILRPA